MKILIIHGSPRRGNTWNIVNRVREKINKEIDVNYEIIELSKMKIPMCTGCFNCILKSEEKCPHYESIKYINNKIDWCDAMIITSPVYSLQVSGQLKNFLDHMSYNFHRPKYFNKKALIITTTAGVNAKEISNYINEVLTFWGINTTYKLPIVYRDNNLEKYDKQIDKVLRNPDYDYWKSSELYKYPYHPDINIGMIKMVFGNTLYKTISKKMKNNKELKYNEREIKIIKRLPKEEVINYR